MAVGGRADGRLSVDRVCRGQTSHAAGCGEWRRDSNGVRTNDCRAKTDSRHSIAPGCELDREDRRTVMQAPILVVLVAALQATPAAAPSTSAPVVQVGIFSYGPDGRPQGAAYDTTLTSETFQYIA